MRIAELAELAGTSPRMLRYYEEEGLLTPRRSPNGYRDYDEKDAQTAQQIVALTEAGLTLAAVRTVLPCAVPDGSHLRACPKVAPELRRQLDIIRGRIAALTRSASAIEDYLSELQPHGDDGGDSPTPQEKVRHEPIPAAPHDVTDLASTTGAEASC